MIPWISFSVFVVMVLFCALKKNNKEQFFGGVSALEAQIVLLNKSIKIS